MSPGSCMQIRYTHKLSMHKADFFQDREVARRLERVRLKQIFSNFEQQCHTRPKFLRTNQNQL